MQVIKNHNLRGEGFTRCECQIKCIDMKSKCKKKGTFYAIPSAINLYYVQTNKILIIMYICIYLLIIIII